MSQITHPFEWYKSAEEERKQHKHLGINEDMAKSIRQAAQNMANSNGKPVLTYKQAIDLADATSITAKEIKQFFHLVEG